MPLRKVIISGGGTGGHIFPAIAIADEIKRRYPECEILFVGANGRMEMTRVPQAGYPIKGLDIAGLQRKLDVRNFLLPFKVVRSYMQAAAIIKDFKPQVAIGVGGYASAPLLMAAQRKGIPTLIQEQNSYAGLTNKLLAKRALRICVAYPGMEQYFPASKLVTTGNPVRKEVTQIEGKREEALVYFGLDSSRPVVLSIGGSLGARSINQALHHSHSRIAEEGIQLIWQTGKVYFPLVEGVGSDLIKPSAFIDRMDLAYAAADVIISRAGALSISELCLIGKPAILVPSPYVSEDHQNKNAEVLLKAGAALKVNDSNADSILVDEAIGLIKNTELRKKLAENILTLGRANATEHIVNEVERLVND